ncbi:MAG: hypothetical protein EAY75_16490 [Bacteroidetes bacterium]|nr:MAG: hypothetical protein EAY75_16490 [Bacteroidota bacterium]
MLHCLLPSARWGVKNALQIATLVAVLASCSPTRQLPGPRMGAREQRLLADTALVNAHVGISVYDAAAQQYVAQVNADKYFVPASNTKLFTCYAAMACLPDSLPALQIQYPAPNHTNVFAMGDPTFLHPDFANQPALAFLRGLGGSIHLVDQHWQTKKYGRGWSWDDYMSSYMPERSPLPVAGNMMQVSTQNKKTVFLQNKPAYLQFTPVTRPRYFERSTDSVYVLPVKWRASLGNIGDTTATERALQNFEFERAAYNNLLTTVPARRPQRTTEMPFITFESQTAIGILQQDYGLQNLSYGGWGENGLYPEVPTQMKMQTIYSQPTDSMLKPMMYRSDNFFAEQSLLMASQLKLGYMNEDSIVKHILTYQLANLPQRPQWVDGSGLSRYNLFTPNTLVALLQTMHQQFGKTRLQAILPSANQGTLTNYYKGLEGKFYAKTGTLSGVVALSGFLYAQSGKLLLFSVLVNNHNSSAPAVRRAVERYLLQVAAKN